MNQRHKRCNSSMAAGITVVCAYLNLRRDLHRYKTIQIGNLLMNKNPMVITWERKTNL